MPGLSDDALDRLHRVLGRIDAGHDLGEVLQAVCDGVVEVSGFTIAAISVPDGPHHLKVVAVSGSDPGLPRLLGERFSRDMMETQWARGESRGRFVFQAEGTGVEHLVDEPGVLVPTFEPLDHPDAWTPYDELNAPLCDPDGELLGSLGVDVPADGLRPSRDVLDVMEVFAMQAALAINQANRREELQEELWLRGMVNELFNTVGEGPVDETFAEALPTVASEIAATDLWVEAFPRVGDGASGGARTWGGETAPTVTATLSALGPTLGEVAARTESAVVLSPALLAEEPAEVGEERRGALLRALGADGVTRVLLAPLRQGRRVIGQVAVFRTDGRVWSNAERAVLLDVGRALGWAVQREADRTEVAAARDEVARQRDERADVLRALARRVRGAMRRVDEHLRDQGLPEDHPALEAMDDFWTLFGHVMAMSGFQGRPDRLTPSPVHLPRLLARLREQLAPRAAPRGVRLLPVSAEGAGDAVALADAELVEWVLLALYDDVVVDVPDGGAVRLVVVRRADRVVVSCQGSGVDHPSDLSEEGEDEAPWWLLGAQALLARMDGRLTTRTGPMGRRTITLDLPVAAR